MTQRIARVAAYALTAALLALPALAPRGHADIPAKERALLEKAAATYASLKSYRLEGLFEIESFLDGETQRLDARIAIAGRRPDHMFERLDHATLGQIMASDGQNTWIYRSALNQYVVQPLAVKPIEPARTRAPSGSLSQVGSVSTPETYGRIRATRAISSKPQTPSRSTQPRGSLQMLERTHSVRPSRSVEST